MIDLILSWYGPSEPSRFLPKVRLSVDGSVSAVNSSSHYTTYITSSHRVTSQSPT